MRDCKAQISIEYLIVVGFVTFVIIGVLGIAIIYSGSVKDKIKFNQLTSFANKLISSSESVFYRGEPSKATISAYLPEGVESIEIYPNDILIKIRTSSGKNRISFSSDVSLSGEITSSPGLKKIIITAQENNVLISQE